MQILPDAPSGAEAPARPEPAPRPIPVPIVNDLLDEDVEEGTWPPFPDPTCDAFWCLAEPNA